MTDSVSFSIFTPSTPAPVNNIQTTDAVSGIALSTSAESVEKNATTNPIQLQQVNKSSQDSLQPRQETNASFIPTNQTFRILGSAPEFQVISSGGNVYLSHSSGYLISLAPGLDRSFVQFNDIESPLKEIVGAEPDSLQKNAILAYSNTGTAERRGIPSGVLQDLIV